MKLIERARRAASYPALSELTGLSVYKLRKLNAGGYSPQESKVLHGKLRGFLESDDYRLAKVFGKLTIKDTRPPVEAPPKLLTRDLQTKEIQDEAKRIKKDFPTWSTDKITNLIDLDRFTREKLATALQDYRTAKQKAIDSYHKRGVKRIGLEEYINRKTKKEYKKLGKAFESRRKFETEKNGKKLLTSGHVDLSIENYGKGRGKWRSLKRL